MAKKAVNKSTAKRKTTVKRAVKKTAKKPVKKPAAKPRRVKPKTTRRPKTKVSSLNGRPSLVKRQSLLVKAARKEGEKTARKQLLAKISKIFKSGKKRKTVKTSKKQRKHIEQDPFDTRRFRGGRRKKKETTEQRLKRLSNSVYTTRDQILLGIANGSFKFKWASVAKECGYGNGERKKMLSILDNKNGYTVNQLAHKIWEDGNGNHGHGKDDDEIRDEIIDVLQSVNSRSDALKQLDRGQGDDDAPF